jgi:hypothetical protein
MCIEDIIRELSRRAIEQQNDQTEIFASESDRNAAIILTRWAKCRTVHRRLTAIALNVGASAVIFMFLALNNRMALGVCMSVLLMYVISITTYLRGIQKNTLRPLFKELLAIEQSSVDLAVCLIDAAGYEKYEPRKRFYLRLMTLIPMLNVDEIKELCSIYVRRRHAVAQNTMLYALIDLVLTATINPAKFQISLDESRIVIDFVTALRKLYPTEIGQYLSASNNIAEYTRAASPGQQALRDAWAKAV